MPPLLACRACPRSRAERSPATPGRRDAGGKQVALFPGHRGPLSTPDPASHLGDAAGRVAMATRVDNPEVPGAGRRGGPLAARGDMAPTGDAMDCTQAAKCQARADESGHHPRPQRGVAARPSRIRFAGLDALDRCRHRPQHPSHRGRASNNRRFTDPNLSSLPRRGGGGCGHRGIPSSIPTKDRMPRGGGRQRSERYLVDQASQASVAIQSARNAPQQLVSRSSTAAARLLRPSPWPNSSSTGGGRYDPPSIVAQDATSRLFSARSGLTRQGYSVEAVRHERHPSIHDKIRWSMDDMILQSRTR